MKPHQLSRNLCFAGLTGLLAFHFLATLAITFPPTPLATEYGRVIDAWMYPYFQQNWSFFAPTPPTEDDFVIAQYTYRSASGANVESPWINLSRTLNEAVQRDRVSSIAIVQATVTNAYCDLLKSELFKDGKLDDKLLQRLVAANQQPPCLHTLERAAMSSFHITNFPGAPVAVRVGILIHQFPRFTHRREPDNPNEHNVEVRFPYVSFEPVAAFD